MNRSEQGTKIGVARAPLDFYQSKHPTLPFSEIDLHEWLELSRPVRSRIRGWIRDGSHELLLSASPAWISPQKEAAREALPERWSMVRELVEETQSSAFLIRGPTPASWPLLPCPEGEDLGFEIWHDPGSSEFPAIESPNRLWVWDPLWHSKRPSSDRVPRAVRWKLHGWHEARWIRYYGPVQLQKLALLTRSQEKKGPLVLWMAHSKRMEEALSFQKLFLNL